MTTINFSNLNSGDSMSIDSIELKNFDTIRIVTNDSTTPDRNLSVNPEKNVSYSASYQIHFPQDTSFSAIFIPSKDMLTHSKGLLAMSDKYREFPFDIPFKGSTSI